MNSFLLLATLNLCVGGLAFLLGVLILRENRRQQLNRVVAFMLFFGGIGSVLGALGYAASTPGAITEDRTLPEDFYLNFAYLWEFFFPTLLLFASIFPQERSFTRKIRAYPLLVFVPHIFHFLLLLAISVFGTESRFPDVALPAMVAPIADLTGLLGKIFLGVHQALFSLVNIAYGAAGAALLTASYRQARVPRIRGQIRVIAVGLTICLVLYSLATSIPTLFNIDLPEWLRTLLTTTALTAGSGAIAYAIVRHKFLDTKLLARRAILYALASALLVGFYLVVVVQLNRLFSRVTGVDGEVFEPVFLIMALILFQPAVARLEELLERFFLRDPGDYRNVLRRLGREILTTIDLDLLLARSIRTVAEALLLESAYIVALSHEGPLIHLGAGDAVPAEDLERLPEVLGRVPVEMESFRLGDGREVPSEEDRRYLRETFGASLVLLLRSKGELVGALILGPKIMGTEYTSEDVSLLTSLGGQLAVSLQNGLLLRERVAVARFEEELNLARQIQRSMLPSAFPTLPGLDVHAVTIPSKEVGGDLYDFVPSSDGNAFYIAIADVSGKGVPAALLSSMLQASLRTQTGAVPSVSEILRNINTLVYRSTSAEQFATFFLAHVDEQNLKLRFSNAGHNYPLLFRRDGGLVELEKGGLILGIMDGVVFEEGALDLRDGDRVVFYTDGISEALNEADEEFGDERLQTIVRGLPRDLSAHEVADQILEELYGFLGDREAQDDVTLMVLQVKEPRTAPLVSEEERLGSREAETAEANLDPVQPGVTAD